jgi:hypothetical protein
MEIFLDNIGNWIGTHWWELLAGTGLLPVVAMSIHRLSPRVQFGPAFERSYELKTMRWHIPVKLKPSGLRFWEKQELSDAIVFIELEQGDVRWQPWSGVFLESDMGTKTTAKCTIGHGRDEHIPVVKREEGNGRAGAELTDARFFDEQRSIEIPGGPGKKTIRLKIKSGRKCYVSQPYDLQVQAEESNRRFRLEEIYEGGM